MNRLIIIVHFGDQFQTCNNILKHLVMYFFIPLIVNDLSNMGSFQGQIYANKLL